MPSIRLPHVYVPEWIKHAKIPKRKKLDMTGLLLWFNRFKEQPRDGGEKGWRIDAYKCGELVYRAVKKAGLDPKVITDNAAIKEAVIDWMLQPPDEHGDHRDREWAEDYDHRIRAIAAILGWSDWIHRARKEAVKLGLWDLENEGSIDRDTLAAFIGEAVKWLAKGSKVETEDGEED